VQYTNKDVLTPKNIQVLSVHPGPIATDMGSKAGFDEIAESTSVVAEGIIDALKAGDFHLFPDTMAKQFEAAYKSYAENITEAEISEG
jgi:short-subunit dehydrogenase